MGLRCLFGGALGTGGGETVEFVVISGGGCASVGCGLAKTKGGGTKKGLVEIRRKGVLRGVEEVRGRGVGGLGVWSGSTLKRDESCPESKESCIWV